MIYLVCGTQAPMVRKRIKKIVDASLNNEIDNMNYVKYDANDVTPFEVIDEAKLLPLGYDKKVIVYENCGFLVKNKSKLTEEDETLILNYLDEDNESTDLIFACFSEVNKSSKLYNKILKIGKIFEIAEPQKNEWFDYVKRYCLDVLKIDIDQDAINELAIRTKNDASSLINNAEKLSLYKDHIQYEDVDLMVTRPLEDNVFRVFDALINKKNTDAIKIFRDLLEQNIVVNNVISILSNQFRLLNQVSYLVRERKSDQEIIETLKLRDWQLRDLKRKSYVISSKTILDALEKLYLLDYQIKSGIIQYEYRNLVFELFLIEFKVI